MPIFAAGVALSVTLSACGGSSDKPSSAQCEQADQALTSALSAISTLGDVTFETAPREWYDATNQLQDSQQVFKSLAEETSGQSSDDFGKTAEFLFDANMNLLSGGAIAMGTTEDVLPWLAGCGLLPSSERTEDGAMSKAEAGALYLDVICAINAASDKLFYSGDPFIAGDSNPDLVPQNSARAAAREAVLVFSQAIMSLQQPGGAWPDSVSDDIAVALGVLEAEVAYFEAISEAATWGDVGDYPDLSASTFARIRNELGLPPSAAGDDGC